MLHIFKQIFENALNVFNINCFRLRDRLHQVEEQEQSQELLLENLKDELQLTKGISASQEQTILDLQQQIETLGSNDEKKKQNSKVFAKAFIHHNPPITTCAINLYIFFS